ncbi:hypothetical protein [Dactylosporangium sp. CA-092794]|uniref:hypothetical protein n=1 Tax=Dactylosporangium sp. CA-092794 TaxID=3239929 RepID=UPI003D8F971E
MDNDDIIRAWKDPDLRAAGLTLPHPAGDIDLEVAGATAPAEGTFTCTFLICTWAHPCDPTAYFSCNGGCEEM